MPVDMKLNLFFSMEFKWSRASERKRENKRNAKKTNEFRKVVVVNFKCFDRVFAVGSFIALCCHWIVVNGISSWKRVFQNRLRLGFPVLFPFLLFFFVLFSSTLLPDFRTLSTSFVLYCSVSLHSFLSSVPFIALYFAPLVFIYVFFLSSYYFDLITKYTQKAFHFGRTIAIVHKTTAKNKWNSRKM